MQEATTEHRIELFDAPYERLRLDMPSTIDPVHIGGFADAVQGADSAPVFWAAIGRYAGALGLQVVHGDAIESERVAFATLSRVDTRSPDLGWLDTSMGGQPGRPSGAPVGPDRPAAAARVAG